MSDDTHLRLVKDRTVASKRRRRTYGSGSVYLRNKTYWISYRLADGKRVSKSAKTNDKEAAEHKLMTELVKVGQGETKQLLPWKFGETAREWFMQDVEGSGKYAYSTIQGWQIILDNHLLPIFENDTLDTLANEPLKLRNYVAAKMTGKSPKTGEPLPVRVGCLSPAGALAAQTVDHHITVLQMIFNWARSDRRVTGNNDPMAKVERPVLNRRDTVKTLEPEQISAIQAQLQKDEDKFLVFVLVHLGLRLGEGLGLRVSDFNAVEQTLAISRTIRREAKGRFTLDPLDSGTKTEAGQRVLRLGDKLSARLVAHIEQMRQLGRIPGKEDELIFPNQQGRLKHPGNWRSRIWDKALQRAGIYEPENALTRKPTPHSLRHTYASRQIAAGTPISQIAHYMGHASPEITLRIYAHIFDSQQKAIADTVELYEDAK